MVKHFLEESDHAEKFAWKMVDFMAFFGFRNMDWFEENGYDCEVIERWLESRNTEKI